MALHLPQAPEPQEITDIAADLPPGTRALLDAAPKLLRELEVHLAVHLQLAWPCSGGLTRVQSCHVTHGRAQKLLSWFTHLQTPHRPREQRCADC